MYKNTDTFEDDNSNSFYTHMYVYLMINEQRKTNRGGKTIFLHNKQQNIWFVEIC